MMRDLPSAAASRGPGSFAARVVTLPAPTLVHTVSGTVVTFFTSEAEAVWRPLIGWVPLLFLTPFANTKTSEPPTAITIATMIHAVRSVPLRADFAATAGPP